MEFIQIVEYKTSKIDEVRKLAEEFLAKRQAEGGGPTPTLVTVAQDRDQDDVYMSIVRFPSHEEAMANSEREDTAEFAQAMGALCDGPPTFRNLDVMMEGI